MPLLAAFFCAPIFFACAVDPPNPDVTTVQCAAAATPIASVQGDGRVSPLLDQQVTVLGVVTFVQPDQGIYIEETGIEKTSPDQDGSTSNAIFIQTRDLPIGVEPGSLISVRGQVAELGQGRNTLTALTDIEALNLCSSAHPLPQTDVALPLGNDGREALEGMRIRINTPLTVADANQFGRGDLTLSGNGLQFQPTELMAPGPQTAILLKQNRAFAMPAKLPQGMDDPGFLISGTPIGSVTGVLAHDGRGLRISLQTPFSGQLPSLAAPDNASKGSLRVVSMNLYNYFNGDGAGGGFPASRGAETMAEFQQQRDRTGAGIRALQPHVIGVMELENDGFEPASAAADFIRLTQASTGASWKAAVPPGGNTGNDKIRVALFYSSDLLEAVGPAQTLTGPEFKRSRQPLAQVFKQPPGGEKVLIVVNHLKSKGSCPDSGDNADQHDGQGCWNPARVAAAEKMTAWVKKLAIAAGTDQVLIIGDINAYRHEDPVNTIRQAGFVELLDDEKNRTYSFIYLGLAGTLDYAFSSAKLRQKVQQAFIWNVNAALPVNMDLPQPWLRFSDHDPVVVDIRLRQWATSD